MTTSIIYILLLSQFVHESVYAYTDPGSGTLIWQLLTAGGVGLLFYFQSFIKKIFLFITKRQISEEKIDE